MMPYLDVVGKQRPKMEIRMQSIKVPICGEWAVASGQWRVGSGKWAVGSVQWGVCRGNEQ